MAAVRQQQQSTSTGRHASSPGKWWLFNGHRLATVKCLKHNSQTSESLGEEAASCGAEQLQKSCHPLSARGEAENWNIDSANQGTSTRCHRCWGSGGWFAAAPMKCRISGEFHYLVGYRQPRVNCCLLRSNGGYSWIVQCPFSLIIILQVIWMLMRKQRNEFSEKAGCCPLENIDTAGASKSILCSDFTVNINMP